MERRWTDIHSSLFPSSSPLFASLDQSENVSTGSAASYQDLILGVDDESGRASNNESVGSPIVRLEPSENIFSRKRTLSTNDIVDVFNIDDVYNERILHEYEILKDDIGDWISKITDLREKLLQQIQAIAETADEDFDVFFLFTHKKKEIPHKNINILATPRPTPSYKNKKHNEVLLPRKKKITRSCSFEEYISSDHVNSCPRNIPGHVPVRWCIEYINALERILTLLLKLSDSSIEEIRDHDLCRNIALDLYLEQCNWNSQWPGKLFLTKIVMTISRLNILKEARSFAFRELEYINPFKTRLDYDWNDAFFSGESHTASPSVSGLSSSSFSQRFPGSSVGSTSPGDSIDFMNSPPTLNSEGRDFPKNTNTRLRKMKNSLLRVFARSKSEDAEFEQSDAKYNNIEVTDSLSNVSTDGATTPPNLPEDVLCRICEELIPFDQIEKHSRSCAYVNKYEYQGYRCDDKISKIISSIKERLDEQNRKNIKKKRKLTDDEISYLQRLMNIGEEAINLDADSSDFEEKSAEILLAIFHIIESHNSVGDQLYIITTSRRIEGVVTEKIVAFRSINRIRKKSSIQTHEIHRKRKKTMKIGPKDFKFLKPISRGAFGAVFLARKRKTGDIYAIKALKISDMIRKNQMENIKTERSLMSKLNCPYVVKIYYSFQAKGYYYIAMEYISGGDLFSQLQALGALEEEVIIPMAAELVLAILHLHKMGIVHRDIKPENILITKDGHLKLTDFGLSHIGIIDRQLGPENKVFQSDPLTDVESLAMPIACVCKAIHRRKNSMYEHHKPHIDSSTIGLKPTLLESKWDEKSDTIPYHEENSTRSPIEFDHQLPNGESDTSPANSSGEYVSSDSANRRSSRHNIIGTPDYIAPEIILGTGHSYECDWWSLGIIIYEMFTGIQPFNGKNKEIVFSNILSRNLTWPAKESDMSYEARDLINQLLQQNPSDRLCGEEIKSHPFFKGVSWNHIDTKPAHFVPNLKNEEDTSYFFIPEIHDTSLTLPLDSGAPAKEHYLAGFSFQNSRLLKERNLEVYDGARRASMSIPT